MSTEKQIELASAAICHVLRRIQESPEVGYYMGHGTESFARLCDAYAAIHGGTPAAALEAWAPKCARDPRRDLTKRIDELEEALEGKALARGCGIEDVPTYGPQNLTALDFMEQVQQLLLTHGMEPARFVAAVSAMFDVDQVPYHALAR